MQEFMVAILALLGILVGYWLRSISARKEKQMLEIRAGDASAAVTALKAELTQAQSLAGARAGFESLAAERQKHASQLAFERDSLHSDLQFKIENERLQSARISALEAELRKER